jgi:hypothetical protein
LLSSFNGKEIIFPKVAALSGLDPVYYLARKINNSDFNDASPVTQVLIPALLDPFIALIKIFATV